MTGYQYLQRVTSLINSMFPAENWMDKKTTFDFLYSGAMEFVRRTQCLRSTQTIASTDTYSGGYTLNYDFASLYQLNRDTGNPLIWYYDGSQDNQIFQYDYDVLVAINSEETATEPSKFAIIPSSVPVVVTSTTTSAGTQAGGESILTNTAGAFLTTNLIVKPGDEIINKTRGYNGYVLSVTDATHLVTAMFDPGQPVNSQVGWESGDTYMILPKRRYLLVMDERLTVVGTTLSVPYLQTPVPVYSSYGFYSLPPQGDEAIINYAAWMYALQNKEVAYGERFNANWERLVRGSVGSFDRMTGKTTKKPKYYV